MQPYGPPADVFSFGVLMWCMAAAEQYPYEAEDISPEEAAHAVACDDLRPRILPELMDEAPELHDLINQCWAHDPLERPTMTDVLDSLLALRDELELEEQPPRVARRRSWREWLWGQ